VSNSHAGSFYSRRNFLGGNENFAIVARADSGNLLEPPEYRGFGSTAHDACFIHPASLACPGGER
jgi:hypothetical protein